MLVLSVISLFNHASVTSLVVVGMIMHRRTSCIRKVSGMNQVSPFLLKSTVACLLPVCVFLYLRKQSIISMVALIGCCILYFTDRIEIKWHIKSTEYSEIKWRHQPLELEPSPPKRKTRKRMTNKEEKATNWRTKERKTKNKKMMPTVMR